MSVLASAMWLVSGGVLGGAATAFGLGSQACGLRPHRDPAVPPATQAVIYVDTRTTIQPLALPHAALVIDPLATVHPVHGLEGGER